MLVANLAESKPTFVGISQIIQALKIKCCNYAKNQNVLEKNGLDRSSPKQNVRRPGNAAHEDREAGRDSIFKHTDNIMNQYWYQPNMFP